MNKTEISNALFIHAENIVQLADALRADYISNDDGTANSCIVFANVAALRTWISPAPDSSASAMRSSTPGRALPALAEWRAASAVDSPPETTTGTPTRSLSSRVNA